MSADDDSRNVDGEMKSRSVPSSNANGNRPSTADADQGDAGHRARSLTASLSPEQLNAVAALAKNNQYEHQSSWKTLRELPLKERMTFFVEHFLLATIAIVVALALIITFVVSYVTKPADPDLTVQGFDMSNYASQLTKLSNEFASSEGLSDQHSVDITGDMDILTNATSDDSAKLLAMVSAGQINVVFGNKANFTSLNKRGLITSVRSVLGESAMKQYADAWVNAKGAPTTDPAKVAGLDLSHATKWKSAGLPSKTYIGFSNVQKSKKYARHFITFLDFG
ncbi:hypothetical protein [Bifidobacterium aquikefiri]|uniref:hypothetical protein n=1 Tax=Bifidobacterium aquikefiri TaxID=1653207 RepID=UPI0039E85B69